MTSMLDRRVDEVRRFNRLYTKRLGVLAENFLRSPFTLAEGRVLHELANREAPSASDVAAALELDPGYLSRILRRFESQGLVTRTPSPADGRRDVLGLTAAGRAAYAPLNERSHDEIAALLAPLPDERQELVLDAMATIAEALAPNDSAGDIVLRDPRVGDYGWVLERHGVLYGTEYGFDAHMEGYVSEVIAAYVANYDAARDRMWIAECNGARVGCSPNHRRAAAVWVAAWSANASPSHAPQATAKWCSGRTRSSRPRVRSTRAKASSRPPPSPTTCGARISPAKRGNSTSSASTHPFAHLMRHNKGHVHSVECPRPIADRKRGVAAGSDRGDDCARAARG
jgi:DNA-binding MarR family transcriptional regulator